jgi:ribosomal protein L16 Arg81 hydroxylase
MISTFQELISPLDEREFSDLLHSRTLTFRPGQGRNRFEGLLDWHTLRDLIEGGVIPPGKFKVTYNTNPVPSPFFLLNDKVNAAKLASLITQGVSVITNPIQSYVPALETLCNDIATHIGEVTYADAIVTTGSGGALKLHYDCFDLIVLQMEGSKRWRIYGPPVIDPVKGMPKQKPPENVPLLDENLQPGDFLFMPAGFWHHCDNGPNLSLHVAITIRPSTGWHAIQALLPQLLDEEIFRVRLTRFDDAAERTVHEAALMARLIEKIGQMSMSELAAVAAKVEDREVMTADQTSAGLES